MREGPVVLAVPVAVLLLAALSWAGAGLDAALAARAAGRPLRVGWLVPLHETGRLLVQRRRTTLAPDALLWRVGGGALAVVAVLKVATIPLGGHVVADLDVGVVWFNAMDVLLWASLWLVGWGANSPYGLIGGYRYLAQALSYELPLMFALVTPAVAAASLRIGDIEAAQRTVWFAAWMPAAFVVYLGAVLAYSFAGPFAYPAGPDLAGGVLAEPSGVDRLVLLAGRELLLAAGAAFAVPLFLGGGAGPVLPGWAWSLLKSAAVLAVLVLVRRALPTVRADRLAEIGWVVALPLVIVQALVVSVVVLVRS